VLLCLERPTACQQLKDCAVDAVPITFIVSRAVRSCHRAANPHALCHTPNAFMLLCDSCHHSLVRTVVVVVHWTGIICASEGIPMGCSNNRSEPTYVQVHDCRSWPVEPWWMLANFCVGAYILTRVKAYCQCVIPVILPGFTSAESTTTAPTAIKVM